MFSLEGAMSWRNWPWLLYSRRFEGQRVLRLGTPIFDLEFAKREKFYVQVWPLNDLETEDESHVKVEFQLLVVNSHFLPRT